MLKNVKHEVFCQEMATGRISADAAYVRAGYAPDRGHAARLAARGNIVARITEIRAQNAEDARQLCKMTKADALQFLFEVITTNIGDVDENNRLAQEVTRDEINKKLIRTKVKMPGKLDALKQMSVMCGWNEPEKIDVTGDALVAAVASIVARKRA